MASFVLVHGAYTSGWWWHKITPLLQQAGHDVVAPTLTGLGERAHLLGPKVGLETHVRDITGIIDYHELHDVVLVGWSYAGMVITGVASCLPARLAHLVYLDSGVPWDGECSLDLLTREARLALEANVVERNGCKVVLPGPLCGWSHDVERGELAEAEVHALHARVRPHPLKTLGDPVRRSSAAAAIPSTYINCTIGKSPGVTPDMQRAREAGCRYREVRGAHSALLTHPREITETLLGLV
jgi:pimeloyl-ACP methyl ester carboxylesterase